MKKITFFFLFALSAQAASADSWSWMTAGGLIGGRPGNVAISDEASCVTEILAAQTKYGIPGNLLLAIGLQEAGAPLEDGLLTVWPWSVNAGGEGRWFKSKSDALAWAHKKRKDGISSIDLGCMQINQRWHPRAFDTFEQAFDSKKNVEYAAQFLLDLKSQTGSWGSAAGSYHSFTPEHRDRYFTSLKNKIAYAETHSEHFNNLRIAGSFTQPEAGTPEDDGQRPIWTSDITIRPGMDAGTLYSETGAAPLFEN